MSCHFQQYLHSLRPLCIQADSSFVSFHTFWLDVAEQAAQIQPLEQPVWALWQEDSYEFLVLLFAFLLMLVLIIINIIGFFVLINHSYVTHRDIKSFFYE